VRSSRARKLLILLLGAIAPSAAISCKAITGLDEFTKGECPGAICSDDGGGLDAAKKDADAADVVAIDAPKGADPVSWARWRMPNYPNDAGIPNVPTYTPVGDTVKDNVTGLPWKPATLAQSTRQQATDACEALPDGPWRLPKRIELVSLLDYSNASIHINAAFTGVKNVKVWTSSEVRPFTGAPNQPYWTVDFGSGVVEPLAGDLVANALCVKGAAQ
jgi:hypothetical protein